MKLITPPLQKNSRGSEVKNLHFILFFLVQKINNPSVNSLFNEVGFRNVYKEEVFKQFYGSDTFKLVGLLQEILHDGRDFREGVIDAPTAEKFNELVGEFQGLDIDRPEGYPFEVGDEDAKRFVISGKVIFPNNLRQEKITVNAYNKNLRSEGELGKAAITPEGLFTISYEPVFPKSEYKTADIFFRIYEGEKEIKEFTVSEVNKTGKTTLPDGLLFNAGEVVDVEIQLTPTSEQLNLSEFEAIEQLITPLLEETKIEELNDNEEHQDFTFLSRETGLDEEKLSRFALAHRLCRQSDISAEFWYGLTTGSFFQDLTKSLTNRNLDKNLPAILTALFDVSPSSINEIFKEVFAFNLISSKSASLLPRWIEAFAAFIIRRTISLNDKDQPPYVKSLMNSAGLTKEKQEKFLSIYLNNRTLDEAFWEKVEKEKGLEEKEIQKLKFAHSLTELGGNNEKIIGLVALLPRINSMRELALKHDTDSLAKLLTKEIVPDNVEGNTAKAKIKNYAATLQQKLFTTETSAVLQRMATDQVLPIKDDKISKGIAKFLNNQPEFNIRTNSIYNAIKTTDAFKGISEKQREEVIGHLKTLQRVQAISPAHDTVVTLMKANISTAHQVTEMPESSFMTAFSKKMGAGVARQVYTNATNLKLRNERALVSMKETVQGSGIAFIDGSTSMEERKMAFDTKAVENNFPVNWENLFGSVDFCECGECNSVYSPAAYFVELLQYLRNNDLDPEETGSLGIKPNAKDIFGTVLEKLFRRRPDLGCLELTCANTNTILPYVDLVNEVMESFVIHLNDYDKSTLNPKQATIEPWNVEDETSGELLAQPQHINNDAYLILKKAVFPFTLPYDRPVDMIRIFLQYLDTSRYELMKTFRAVEQNTISKDVMPEDTILPASPSPDPEEAKIPAFNKMVSDRAIDSEFLSITQEEYIILTKEAFLTKDYFNLRTPGITEGQYRSQIGVKAVPEYYGYIGINSKADMLDTSETLQVGLTFVKKQFLKRTGLLYVDLVELLKTASLNPLYPTGTPLVVLESIPCSYRFLQGLVDNSSSDPEIRLSKVIEALENPQKYIPGYDEMTEADPCKPARKRKPAFQPVNIKQWVLCYFDRIGQIIVLENNSPDCECLEGQFIRSDGSEFIQIVDTEGQLFLTKDCDLILTRRDFRATVGHIDGMTGMVSLTDSNGNKVDTSLLTNQNVVFKGKNGEIGFITQEKLIDSRTEKPFSCRQAQIDTCDLSKVRLTHLNGHALTVTEYDKMHRFIRLWRKMGWSIDETDKSLVALTANKTTFTKGFNDACDPEIDPKGFAEITPEYIHQLVSLKKLVESAGLELSKLLTFWTDISTGGEKSLYKRLFLTHNLLAIDNVFKADANGNFLTKPNKIADHIPVLMAAFNLKSEEIETLISTSDPLTLQSVSAIYRSGLLARLLHIKTTELKEAFVLFGNPFLDADKVVEFFDQWDKMDNVGFTFSQLNYIIQDIDNPLRPLKPSRKTILNLSKTIYDGLINIDNTHPDLARIDPIIIKQVKDLTPGAKKKILQKIATTDLVRSKISLLFDQQSVEAILGLLQGTTIYATPAPANLVKSTDEFYKKIPNKTPAQKEIAALLRKKVSYDFTGGTLQITGILTTKEMTVAKALFKKAGWKPAFKVISDQAQYIFDDLLLDLFQKDILGAIKVLLDGDIANPDDPSKDTGPKKREYFLETFLPFLRNKLKEKFLIDTLSGATDLDYEISGIFMNEILEGASSKKIMTIFKEVNLPLPPKTIGWQGHLIPKAEDQYKFTVKNNTKPFSLLIDGENILDEKVPLQKNLFTSNPIKLKAGQQYLFEVKGLNADLSDINWSTPVSPKSPLAIELLLPIKAVNEVEEGFIKLFKAGIIANGFSLQADDVSWLQTHAADFDKLDFNMLTLKHLLRIEAFTRLRNSLPGSDLTLIDFFEWVGTAPVSTLLSEQIALLINRKKEEIEALIASPHFNLVNPKDFTSEINLLKIQEALFVYDKININPDLLFEWAQPVSTFKTCQEIAETIQKSLQARYKQEDWERVVKPMNDQLREHQKWALINYLLVQPDLILWGAVDADSLFEFFLIDVQMDACMQTSRLKQAISSVQLFVQRCFLGEEESRGVPNKILDRVRWNWMQRNPLWVANRKVFLYPENWIESNLRDDKSSFFQDLESELLQKDINKQNVEEALKTYLHKVNEVANLEPVALYVDGDLSQVDKWTGKLHVFGRSRNTPHIFFYRSLNLDEKNWTHWEKVEIDIPSYDIENDENKIVLNGCFITPQVVDNRLLIFFPQFTKKTNPKTQSQFWEIKMAWSEYKNNKWTQKQVSKDALFDDHLEAIQIFTFIPFVQNENIYINVYYLGHRAFGFGEGKEGKGDDITNVINGTFVFSAGQLFVTHSLPNSILFPPKLPNYFNYSLRKTYSWQSDGEQIIYYLKEPYFYFAEEYVNVYLKPNSTPAEGHSFSHNFIQKLIGLLNSADLKYFFAFNLDPSITDPINDGIAHEFFGYDKGFYNELKSAYAIYNWELFFHVPLMIAETLSKSQQFEEAMRWYHFIFDPTEKGLDKKRFWKFYPFKTTGTDNLLDTFFKNLLPNQPNDKVNEWRNNPFKPHLIARNRYTAYMKKVVMDYIDNLVAWGDYLFRQDTIETLNQATQIYVLAGHVLGPSPQMIPKIGQIKPETYNSLLEKWDAFGNAMVEMELMAPFSNQTPTLTTSEHVNRDVQRANIFGFASSLYFCIPNNPKLMGYWDTITDRLFKIRHCENIEGIFRMLPLWDPPIDPALLVRATALGLNLDSVLNDLNTPLPNYRFFYLIQKALELCNEVKSLGNSLLSILEKKDGERLANMKAGYETTMHSLVMEVKKLQLEEANKALDGLQQNRKTVEYRLHHYLKLVGENQNKIPTEDKDFAELTNQLEKPIDESGLKLIGYEKEEMEKSGLASQRQGDAATVQVFANIAHAIPNFNIKWPTDGTQLGGSNLGSALSAWSTSISDIARRYTFEAAQSSKLASFKRQLQDRILQANLAGYECKQIDKQIISQKIRINVSKQEITNQQKLIDQSAEVEEFLKNKYTNEELYKWIEGQIKTVYHQVYNLAYDWAKKAELVFRFERGLTSSNFIQYGYWEASREGLQSGEKLFLGLKQLEAAYQENKGYDFEVTKHISLRQLDPLALLELRETGKCEFSIPEGLIDMDFPGHYMRRIKSISLSIPCIAGPYTSVNATFRLQSHISRVSSIATNSKDYVQKMDENDERFISAHIPISSIATSSGQHDSGVFELNFKDERYMPFEGAGVISNWLLELPVFKQFNYETISDIIIHVNYTSKDGGDKLKGPASAAVKDYMKKVEELSQREGLFVLFDVKNDFPNEWHKAMTLPLGVDGRIIEFGDLSERLPYFTKNGSINASDIYIVVDTSVKVSDMTILRSKKTLPGTLEGPEKIKDSGVNLFHMSGQKLLMDKWSIKFADNIKEPSKMWMVVRYSLA